MLQSKNCIRLGQVLMDENRHFFILCNNCHTDIRNIPEFRRHLEKCEGLEGFFREGQTIKYNTDKSTQLFGKTPKGIKEFLIYDYTDVDAQFPDTEKNFINLINIEEELLDPKWYSDLSPEEDNENTTQKSTKQYDVLVEEVTPFVQFKENVKCNTQITAKGIPEISNMNTNVSNAKKAIANIKPKPVTKRKPPATNIQNAYPLPPLPQPQVDTGLKKSSVSLQCENSCQVPLVKRYRVENGAAKCIAVAPITNPILVPSKSKQVLVTNAPSKTNGVSINPLTYTTQFSANQSCQPAKEKQTAQILNKLQNLGLQVKRTHPLPTPSLNTCKKTDDKTLEILLKLQSKGMRVKVLNNKQSVCAALNNDANFSSELSTNFGHTNSINSNLILKQNLNKNLIIRSIDA